MGDPTCLQAHIAVRPRKTDDDGAGTSKQSGALPGRPARLVRELGMTVNQHGPLTRVIWTAAAARRPTAREPSVVSVQRGGDSECELLEFRFRPFDHLAPRSTSNRASTTLSAASNAVRAVWQAAIRITSMLRCFTISEIDGSLMA